MAGESATAQRKEMIEGMRRIQIILAEIRDVLREQVQPQVVPTPPEPAPQPQPTPSPAPGPTPPNPPQLPHTFYGVVEGGKTGDKVQADVEGGVLGPNNPTPVFSSEGHYGGLSFTAPKLVVQGQTVKANAPIYFTVNGKPALCRVPPGSEWRISFSFQSGSITELNLKV